MIEKNMMAAHYNLGIYYSKEKSHQKAIFQFKKAIEYTKDPKQIKKLKNIARKEVLLQSS